MGTKKIGGFKFITYATDHRPYHVHVYYEGKELGRYNLEKQEPLDKKMVLSRKIIRALKQYLKEDGGE